jgi:hypothetical protein
MKETGNACKILRGYYFQFEYLMRFKHVGDLKLYYIR